MPTIIIFPGALPEYRNGKQVTSTSVSPSTAGKRQSAVFHACRITRSRYTDAIAGSVPASTTGGMPARRFSLGKVNR